MSDETTSGANGAAEAPAGAEVPNPLKPNPEAYKQKLCPILSAPMMRPGEQSLEVAACKGPLCMLFVPIVEIAQDGKQSVRDGQCALALIPTGLSHLKDTAIAIEQNRMARAQPLVQPSFKNIKR